MKKRVALIIVVILIVIGLIWLAVKLTPTKTPDNVKFSSEYTSLSTDNVFVYKSQEEIIKIIEHGTGVVFLGFPSCPWCQKYVTYLNEVAKENGIKEINYLNIKEDRANNTEAYKKIVSLISAWLENANDYDKDGNLRIYVPAVIVVKNGEILGFDDETARDTKGYKTPEEYWSNEDLDGLKSRLKEMFNILQPTYCSDECN